MKAPQPAGSTHSSQTKGKPEFSLAKYRKDMDAKTPKRQFMAGKTYTYKVVGSAMSRHWESKSGVTGHADTKSKKQNKKKKGNLGISSSMPVLVQSGGVIQAVAQSRNSSLRSIGESGAVSAFAPPTLARRFFNENTDDIEAELQRTSAAAHELSRDLPGPYFERAPLSARRRRGKHSLSPIEYSPNNGSRLRIRPGTAPSKLIGKTGSGPALAGIPVKMNAAQRYIARQNLKEAQKSLLNMEMELKELEAAASAEELRQIEAEEKAEMEALRREEEAREQRARQAQVEAKTERERVEEKLEAVNFASGGAKTGGPRMTYAQHMRHLSATKIAAVYRGHKARAQVEAKIVKDQSSMLGELAELRKKKIAMKNRRTALEAARAQRKRLLRGMQQRDAVAAQEELAVEEEEPLPFQWPGEEKWGGGGGDGGGSGGDKRGNDGRGKFRLGRGRMTMLMSTSQRDL